MSSIPCASGARHFGGEIANFGRKSLVRVREERNSTVIGYRGMRVSAAKAKEYNKSKADVLSKKSKKNDILKRKSWPKSWSPWWAWDGSPDEDMSALEEWLRLEGMPQQKVTLNPVQEGERGLIAKQDINKGETLLYIPSSLTITAQTVYDCPLIGEVVKAAGVPDWPALAIYILSEGGRGKDSKWSAYLEALPQNPACILMWPIEEVDRLLEASPARQKAIECIAEVTETYTDLNKVLFSQHPDLFPPQLFTLDAFKWAFSILFSRLVRLTSRQSQVALVPWGDMINHSCDVSCYLDYDQLSGSVVLKTDRKYTRGQQIYVSYGPKPNGELLVAYGMVPAVRNPNNATPVQLGLSSEDPLLEAKLSLLQQNGLGSPQSFPIKMEGLPTQLLAYARFVVAQPDAGQQSLQQLAEAASKQDGFQRGIFGFGGDLEPSLEEEISVREVILAACQVALAGYSTSLEEDERVLQSTDSFSEAIDSGLTSEPAIQERVQAAAALRAGEKKILLRTEAVLRVELKDLRNQVIRKDGRTKIELGNNFGGKGKDVVSSILRRIASPW